ncbi:MAG: hypothetical protein QF473_17175 [Planctomycetota bacterium]|jgi:hypothetical protein|nr:hypothetical protein [Planctomycetota bacterium]MDP6504685.1 hypothetical protein [Planctomycetota bacterium]
MQIFFLASVDCDHVRGSTLDLRQQTFDALLDVFAETGVTGHATWFLNETYRDYCTTGNHPQVVHEAIRRGDCIGIHDHIDELDGRWEYDAVFELCEQGKRSAERWLETNGYQLELRSHRFGCLFQRAVCYQVIADLGYTVVSDIYPGDKSPNHTGHLSYDNVDIPVGISPYRHDAENFKDFRSQIGRFIQVPVTQMYYKRVEMEKLRQWIEAVEGRGGDQAFLTLCFHPYELLNDRKDSLSQEGVAQLRALFRNVVTEFGAEFASLNECVGNGFP